MKCRYYLNGACCCYNSRIIKNCPNHLPYGECKLAEAEDEFDYIDSLIDNDDY